MRWSSPIAKIEALVEKSFIRKDASKCRAFEITDPNDADSIKPEKTVNVPLVGRIAAGGPITKYELPLRRQKLRGPSYAFWTYNNHFLVQLVASLSFSLMGKLRKN
jgi:SOS-response transcriptional repressor LexA